MTKDSAGPAGRHRLTGLERSFAVNRKIIVVVLMVIATSILLLPLLRNHELAQRLVCGSNIQLIGSALRIYANDFPGSGTSSLEWLVNSGNIPKDTLICPSSGLDTCNYVMVPLPAPGERVDDRRVVIYEPKSNHGEGGCFLFADGHLEFMRGRAYDLAAREPSRWW